MKIKKIYYLLLVFFIFYGCSVENKNKKIEPNKKLTKEVVERESNDINSSKNNIKVKKSFYYSNFYTFKGHKERVTDITIQNSILASADESGEIRLSDIKQKKFLKLLKERFTIIALKFFHNSNFLISSNSNQEIIIWEIEKNRVFRKKKLFSFYVTSITIDKNDNIITGCSDGKVRFYNRDLKEIRDFKAHKGAINSIATNNNFIVTGGEDKKTIIWDSKYNIIRVLHHLKRVNSVAINKNIVASGGEDGKIILYNLINKREKAITIHKKGIIDLLFYNDNYIISSSKDNSVRFSNIDDAKTEFSLFLQLGVSKMVLDLEKNYLIYGLNRDVKVIKIEEK